MRARRQTARHVTSPTTTKPPTLTTRQPDFRPIARFAIRPADGVRASFDHSKTKFPLTGNHATLPCVACHVNGNFTSLQTTCVSCHLNDYNGTTDPNHKAAGFPTDCQVCHSTSS